MKFTRTIIEEIEVKPDFFFYNRIPTQNIESNYLGKMESNIGIGFCITLKNGVLNIPDFLFPRLDIACIQFDGFCNVFVYVDGKYQVDFIGQKDFLQKEQKKEIDDVVKEFFVTNKEFISKQKRFLSNWRTIVEQLNSKTPEKAIEILKSQGF